MQDKNNGALKHCLKELVESGWNWWDFSRWQNVHQQLMSWSSDGRLFHVVGQEMEKTLLFINTVCWWIFVSCCILVARTTSDWSIKFLKIFVISIIIIMMHSIQPKPSAIVIICQNGLSSTSCRASVTVTPVCVAADLVNPGGGWLTTGTSPFLRWPLAISRLGTHSKDLIGWYGVWKSGNVAE